MAVWVTCVVFLPAGIPDIRTSQYEWWPSWNYFYSKSLIPDESGITYTTLFSPTDSFLFDNVLYWLLSFPREVIANMILPISQKYRNIQSIEMWVLQKHASSPDLNFIITWKENVGDLPTRIVYTNNILRELETSCSLLMFCWTKRGTKRRVILLLQVHTLKQV